MNKEDLNNNIISLLKDAERAHKQEFKTGIIEDPEWPLWFSEQMKDKLEKILERHFTIGELVYLLTSAEKLHKKSSPESDWVPFCADFLIRKK